MSAVSLRKKSKKILQNITKNKRKHELTHGTQLTSLMMP